MKINVFRFRVSSGSIIETAHYNLTDNVFSLQHRQFSESRELLNTHLHKQSPRSKITTSFLGSML